MRCWQKHHWGDLAYRGSLYRINVQFSIIVIIIINPLYSGSKWKGLRPL